MSTKAGVGVSRNKKDSYRGGQEAAQAALKELGGEKPNYVLLFTTDEFDQEKTLAGVRSITGNAELAGCSTGGVITKEGLSQDSLAVALLKSDEITFISAVGDKISLDAKAAGRKMAEQMLEKVKEKGQESSFGRETVMMLPNGFSQGNISEVVRGAYEILGATYRFSGGGSGDNLKFKKTFQFLNDKIYNDAVVGTLFISKKKQGVGLKHGWKPWGEIMVVTKVEGKVVKELDGKPALEVYMNLRGEKIAGFDFNKFYQFAMDYPLGIVSGGEEFIIRDPFTASPEDNSITFVSEIPENSIVRMMKGDVESILEGGEETAKEAVSQMEGRVGFAMIFDCISRLLLLGEKAAQEIEKIRKVIGTKTPFIGFYTFGEVGIEKGGQPVFCNKTCSVHLLP